MNLNQLQELKQVLVKASDLSEVWSFFMTHFADHEAFTNLGGPADHAFLEDLIPQICSQMFGKKMPIDDLLLVYIAEYQFIHGSFHTEGHLGGILYFEDIKVGLLAVLADFPAGDEVRFSRFSESLRMTDASPYDHN